MAKEAEKEIRILVIDSDETYRDALKKDYESSRVAPSRATPKLVTGGSLRDCQKSLSDRDFEYIAAFINPAMGAPSWVATVKNCHQFRPSMPVYVVCNTIEEVPAAEFGKLGIVSGHKKPDKYKGFLSLLEAKDEKAVLKPAEAAAIPKPVTKAPEIPALEAELKAEDFLAVDLANKITSAVSQFDLFVKLSSGKFVQILKAGDKLTRDRIDKYHEHGAQSLFVRKKDQALYLRFCDEIISKMLKDPGLSYTQKAKEVALLGTETTEYLRTQGFNSETLKRAEIFVSSMAETVAQLTVPSPACKDWICNVVTYEHGVAVSTIAGMMLKNIGVQNQATFNAIGIACFLHDIGLIDHPELIHEDEKRMDAAQLKIFHEHPTKGAKMLSDVKSIPAAVIHAVEEHHLKANGTGFPSHKGVTDLSLIAEVVGLAEDFSHLISRSKSDSKIDPFREIEAIAHTQYSKKIASAFLRTIKEK